MDEQRVPDLEVMDEQQAQRFLTELMSDLGPESGYEVRHEDFLMELPQSGERIRGREKRQEFQRAYPAPRPCGCVGYWCGRCYGLQRSSQTMVGKRSITYR
jgi:hypothetical protein